MALVFSDVHQKSGGQGMHDDAKDGEKEVWLSGSPELKRWFIWGSCHPLGKLSRVQILATKRF